MITPWILLIFLAAPQPVIHQVGFANEVACKAAAIHVHNGTGAIALCVAYSKEGTQ